MEEQVQDIWMDAVPYGLDLVGMRSTDRTWYSIITIRLLGTTLRPWDYEEQYLGSKLPDLSNNLSGECKSGTLAKKLLDSARNKQASVILCSPTRPSLMQESILCNAEKREVLPNV